MQECGCKHKISQTSNSTVSWLVKSVTNATKTCTTKRWVKNKWVSSKLSPNPRGTWGWVGEATKRKTRQSSAQTEAWNKQSLSVKDAVQSNACSTTHQSLIMNANTDALTIITSTAFAVCSTISANTVHCALGSPSFLGRTSIPFFCVPQYMWSEYGLYTFWFKVRVKLLLSSQSTSKSVHVQLVFLYLHFVANLEIGPGDRWQLTVTDVGLIS